MLKQMKSKPKALLIILLPLLLLLAVIATFFLSTPVPEAQTDAEAGKETKVAAKPKAEPAYLREGDSVIDIPLKDENGEKIALRAERPTVLTFIFTRCPDMEFCPRMTGNFETIQTELEKQGSPELRLLSITLDPEFDRPERLKEYGEQMGADPEHWKFATGSKEAIDRLTKAFRVRIERDDSSDRIDHALCTALIQPDGTITKVWRGNFWEPEDVLAEVKQPQ